MSRLGKKRRKRNGASFIQFVYGRLEDPPSDIRPRAFPLWLLAPRLLGAVLFLAFPACSRVLGHRLLLGRGRNPLPSFGLLLAVSVGICSIYRFFLFLESATSFLMPSESALAQPLSTFSFLSLVCRFRFYTFETSINGGAHIQPRHSGNARGLILFYMCLTHPPVRAHSAV